VTSIGSFPDLFDAQTLEQAIGRINALTPSSQPVWGKMTVAQMLAHCCVTYEMVYTDIHPRPNPIMRWVLRTLVKGRVMDATPYAQGTPTAPAFRITDSREFAAERERLIAYLQRVAAEGRAKFEGRESLSFGPLTAAEWNALMSKHLDHHLRQFGV
jgi:DinB superfamily